MPTEPQYPTYLMHPYSDLAGSRFVGFYMDESDAAKIKAIFPNGCNTSDLSVYTLCPEFDNTPVGQKRTETWGKINAFTKENNWKTWDLSNLLHDGYRPIWCRNGNEYTLMCCKGKTKPNKHTHIVLMEKVPARVEAIFKKAWKEYAIPLIEIIESN